MYILKSLPQADKDIEAHKKSGNKAVINKIKEILQQLKLHPRTGIGKPEQLKYGLFAGYWSRHINDKDRIIYDIRDAEIIVIVISAKGHYDDH